MVSLRTDFRPQVMLILSHHRLTRKNRPGWVAGCAACSWSYRGATFAQARVQWERHLADLFCEWLDAREAGVADTKPKLIGEGKR